jgi:hypothetical protein
MPDVVLEILIGADGIRRIRVFGETWLDSGEANALLARIKPFLDLIHQELTKQPGLKIN